MNRIPSIAWQALALAITISGLSGCYCSHRVDRFTFGENDAGPARDASSEDSGLDVDGGHDAALVDAAVTPDASRDAAVDLPDLTVSCSALDIEGAGSEGRIDIEVTNTGAAPAAGFRVRVTALLLGETTRDEVLGTAVFVDSIVPLEMSTQSIGFTAPADTSAGTIDATCVVDALEEVLEEDEGNNTSTFAFEATELPNLTGNYNAGAVAVRNTGTGNSRAFFVPIYFARNCVGPPDEVLEVPYLASGDVTWMNYDPPTCVNVDASNHVPESDESDNLFYP